MLCRVSTESRASRIVLAASRGPMMKILGGSVSKVRRDLLDRSAMLKSGISAVVRLSETGRQ